MKGAQNNMFIQTLINIEMLILSKTFADPIPVYVFVITTFTFNSKTYH